MTSEHPELRIGNTERDDAISLLRGSAEQGSLTGVDLDQRVALVRAAKTRAELEAALSGLAPLRPVPAVYEQPTSLPNVPGPAGYSLNDQLILNAGVSGARRDGAWVVPPYLRVQALFDTVRLDCLTATAAGPVIDLEVLPGAGTVVVMVPEGWAVNADRLAKGIGTITLKVAHQPTPGNPIIVARGSIGMGTFKARGANWLDRRRLGQDR